MSNFLGSSLIEGLTSALGYTLNTEGVASFLGGSLAALFSTGLEDEIAGSSFLTSTGLGASLTISSFFPHGFALGASSSFLAQGLGLGLSEVAFLNGNGSALG
jgi:hypothetical protein